MSAKNDRFRSWQQRLNLIIEELDRQLQSSSLKTVLPESGPEYLKQINDESANIARLVTQIIEHEQGFNLDQFDGFHKSISTSINETLSDITSTLDTLKLKLTDIQELKSALEEVSYSIKNVSLLMKIKTTKMGKSEFDHVVKGLEGLASQIKENTEGINVSAMEATENITQTCEQIDERLNRFNLLFKPNRAQVNELQETIGDIAAKILKRCKRIKSLAEQGDQLIESIRSTVTQKPQFADRMQEVQQALNSSVSTLSDEAGGEDAIHSVTDILAGQIDQIGQWEHELDTVEQRIAKDLRQLQQLTTEQDEVARAIGEIGSVLKPKMDVFETDFSSISSTFTFSEDKTQEILTSIAAINENVTNVSRQVTRIDIGRTDLEALTYNAVFKAAKVGMQGKVMESITDEITGLSREMQSKVTDKETVIKSIVSSAKEFKSSLSEKLNRQLNFSNDMNLKIREHSQKFYDDLEKIMAIQGQTTRLEVVISRTIEEGIDDQDLTGLMQKVQMGLADILNDMQQSPG